MKVVPVVQFLTAGAAIVLLAKYLPQYNLIFEFQEALSYVISALAFLILAGAIFSFQQAKTTVDPMHPEKATSLVTSGIYRITRNPMYMAMLLLLVAFCIQKGTLLGLVPTLAFIWSMTTFQIKPEEKALTEIFGESYLTYKGKVRRWI
ncbi:MAG: isoprenylcysteine carboxylmethyltransferase family protein [Cyclobacteriaceae bacterium]